MHIDVRIRQHNNLGKFSTCAFPVCCRILNMKSLKRTLRSKRQDLSDSDSESVQKNSKRRILRKSEKPKPACKKKHAKEKKDTSCDQDSSLVDKNDDDLDLRNIVTAMETADEPFVNKSQNDQLSTDVVVEMLVSAV